MLIAVFTTFAVSRKEPLGDVVKRIHEGFLAAGFGEPRVHFVMTDPPGSLEGGLAQQITGIKQVSSIARVLKRWPELERFAQVVGSAAMHATNQSIRAYSTAALSMM
jgi:hypothetical protein